MLNSNSQFLIIKVGIYKPVHEAGKIDPCHNELYQYQHEPYLK